MSVSGASLSDTSVQLNIYEEVINDETTYDLSSKNLESIPDLPNRLLCVLYLQNNKISKLPDDFFPSLPSLMWLDLRDNELLEIPATIQYHPCLTHLLLQNNKVTSLPTEVGTVNLKVLQLNGNPITDPPKDILNGGIKKLLNYLHDKHVEKMLSQSHSDIEDTNSADENFADLSQVVSYNSVIHGETVKKPNHLSIQFSEKDFDDPEEECYAKTKGKCPKLAKSRHQVPPYYQSAKYVPPLRSDSQEELYRKMKLSYLKEMAIKKHKNLLALREKILQGRKNFELQKNWRKNYRFKQQFADSSYELDPNNIPYDTAQEYMTVLSREDIEKDLPDKYKKRLLRRSKPTVPRKNDNDVHLAMKIKQLFENLEAIDLNRGQMTPRTEQKLLLSEIQKITEIKQKLSELSTTNIRSVAVD